MLARLMLALVLVLVLVAGKKQVNKTMRHEESVARPVTVQLEQSTARHASSQVPYQPTAASCSVRDSLESHPQAAAVTKKRQEGLWLQPSKSMKSNHPGASSPSFQKLKGYTRGSARERV